MAENLEPINIDINMRQNVSEESDRASRGMDNMANSSKTLKEQIEIQRKVIADLEIQYARAKAVFDKVNIGTHDTNIIAQREKASKLFREVRAELNAEKQGLTELEKELNKVNQAQDKASNSSISYMTQMRKIRQEMQELAMAGKQESNRYRELEAELARVGTAYNRVRAEQRLLTTAGNAHIAGLMQGMTGIAGVFSAGQGAASLFVKNNEQLAAIQTKLQAAMAITIGLQQVSNTLHATSAFRINTVTKLTNLWRSAQMMLNTQLGISLALSKGLMLGGIGILLAGIAALVYKYKEWNKEQKETARLNKIVTDSIKTAALEGEKSAQKEITSLKLLYTASQNEKKSKEERIKAVKEIQKLYPGYFGNLSQEQILAGKGADAYNRLATSIIAAAKARAAADRITENESKILDLEAKKTEAEAKKNFAEARKAKYIKEGDALYGMPEEAYAFQQSTIGAAADDAVKYAKEVDKTTREIEKLNEANKKLADTIKVDDLLYDSKKDAKDFNKNLKAGENAAEKARKQARALKKAQEKQTLQEIRAAEDLEMQINEAEIKAMDEGSKKVLAQMEFNHLKEQQALKRQQEDALKSKKDNARAIFEASPENKGKTFDDSVIKLTEEELKKYQDLQTKNTESFEKDKFNLELQYMRDYINEYGTFQQKKLSIAQEYDKKIAASSNEYERKSLENQKRTAISNIDFEAIYKKIDWQGVFGNMTGMLDSQLKETLSGLKEYIKSDQFMASSDIDKKTVYEAIEKLKSVISEGQGTLNFGEIKRQMDGLGAAINRLQTATLNEKIASDHLVKSQKEYDNALKTGNQALIDTAKQALDLAKNSANEASEAYKSAESDVQSFGNNFKETAGDTVDGLNLVADGLTNFASNSLPAIFKGLQNTLSGLSKLNISGEVGEAIGSLSKALSNASIVGQIISAVLSILDILKDGIGTLVSSLIDTILNAVDGILKNLLTGKMFAQIFNSLKDGIGNILNTISFGGFNSLVNSINGSNAKETAETISKLTATNEALIVSVDALKEEMAGSNGVKSIEAYNEAVNAQKRYNENLRQILDAQMGYHSSHHSNSYYWDLDPKSLKEVNKLLGTSLKNTWGDFSKLTADQMNEIRTHLPDIWSEMINQGKYGDRFKDDWNNYADQAGKVAELTEDLRENIAQISFESLRDSFVNALMDMDADAQDFAGNFEEYMTKALLNFAIGDLLDDDLKKWYESWTDSMNSQAGKLTEEQIEQYRKQWEQMVQDGLDKRDEIADLTGYTGKNDSGRSASKGGVASASQDSINELNGGIYALRQQVGDIRNLEKESVLVLRTQQASLNRIVENTEFCRYLLDVKNSLEDMQTRGIKVKI